MRSSKAVVGGSGVWILRSDLINVHGSGGMTSTVFLHTKPVKVYEVQLRG